MSPRGHHQVPHHRIPGRGDVVTVAVTGIGSLTTGVVRGLDRIREAFGIK